jgi:hypothetical protein
LRLSRSPSNICCTPGADDPDHQPPAAASNQRTMRCVNRYKRDNHLVNAGRYYLVAVIVLLSVFLIVRQNASPPTLHAQIVTWVAFALNAGIAIYGLFTPYRSAWAVYLVVSLAGMLLIGAATPVVALWVFGRIASGW